MVGLLSTLAIGGLGLGLAGFVLVVRDYERTLATAIHAGWMRALGPDRTQRVIAVVLWMARFFPASVRDAALDREAAAKAQALQAADTPRDAVLLAGSSTFTYWIHAAADLAPLVVVNAGFGGSTTEQVNQQFDVLVRPFEPRVIVYFAGTNDITLGLPPQTAIYGFWDFVARVEAELEGTVAIVYLGVNTTPYTRNIGGPGRVAEVRAVNEGVRAFVDGYAGRLELVFVDLDAEAWSDDPSSYLWDGHHLDNAGHVRLAALLRPHLERFFEPS